MNEQATNCVDFSPLNSLDKNGIFETEEKEDATGKFFGQSSFPLLSMVSENSAVNACRIGQERMSFTYSRPLAAVL
jgi:hypothetical protein